MRTSSSRASRSGTSAAATRPSPTAATTSWSATCRSRRTGPASGTRIATTCTTWPSPGRCRCCAPAASPPCSRHGSRWTPTTPAWRRRLAAEVDLVAAFRLPSRTHREAGTDVVTDLLILRRPLPGEHRPEPDWLDVEQLALDADTTTTVNRYWNDHPDHVLGRIEPGGAYRRENFNVVADRPAHDALAEALADGRA